VERALYFALHSGSPLKKLAGDLILSLASPYSLQQQIAFNHPPMLKVILIVVSTAVGSPFSRYGL
jgi:hypothetical protein